MGFKSDADDKARFDDIAGIDLMQDLENGSIDLYGTPVHNEVGFVKRVGKNGKGVKYKDNSNNEEISTQAPPATKTKRNNKKV